MWTELPTPVRAGGRMASLAFDCLAAAGRARSAPPSRLIGRALAFRALCANVCRSHDLDIEVVGPVPAGAALLAANHLSYLDAVVIGAVLPIAPIAKLEVEKWPLIGEVGRTHGVLFLDRASPMAGAAVLRRAARALAGGLAVLNFPEGTTTDGGPLLGFRRGGFGLATRYGAPVVPVALRFSTPEAHWTGQARFLPHYLRTAARPRLGARVRFGAPLHAAPGERAQDLAARTRARVAALLED